MIRSQPGPHVRAPCLWRAAVAALAAGAALPAAAIDVAYGGRVTFGSTYRLEAPDPNLLNSSNAAAAGLTGVSKVGQNADDSNINFRRHDATTRVLKAYLDLTASEGGLKALARVKAWHDFALADNPRAWGNIASGYVPGAPLSDSGAPLLSRFSGVALSEFFVQYGGEVGGRHATVRAGRQSLGWGVRGFAGGLSALDPVDLPATRRAGATPQETKVPVPALFGRIEAAPGLALEGFYQLGFRPAALDMCGTFWSVLDYLADGCGKAFGEGRPRATACATPREGLSSVSPRRPKPTSASTVWALHGNQGRWRPISASTTPAIPTARRCRAYACPPARGRP